MHAGAPDGRTLQGSRVACCQIIHEIELAEFQLDVAVFSKRAKNQQAEFHLPGDDPAFDNFPGRPLRCAVLQNRTVLDRSRAMRRMRLFWSAAVNTTVQLCVDTIMSTPAN